MGANTQALNALPSARRYLNLPGAFSLFRGGCLPTVDIAYETWGRLSPTRDNAILIFTGISPSAHAASSPEDPDSGWWEYMIGPGKSIDTRKYFVICVNSLGSCFGSSGPASLNPKSDEPYRLDFPELSVEDIACAGRKVYRSLGIEQLYAVVGPSLGGMSALALAVLYPDEVARLVSISAAAQSLPFAIAIRSLAREIIRGDPKWSQGQYAPSDPPIEGMRLARKLGLITYRSADEYKQRFGRKRKFEAHSRLLPFSPEFEVEHYLEHNAGAFGSQFDPNCYLYLSRAIDWFDLSLHGGSVEDALARINTLENLIIGVESDFLFPLSQQREIAKGLEKWNPATYFEALPSIQGHDSFLIDEARFAPLLKRFFA